MKEYYVMKYADKENTGFSFFIVDGAKVKRKVFYSEGSIARNWFVSTVNLDFLSRDEHYFVEKINPSEAVLLFDL